jgi:hypothetical protein
MSPLFAWEPPAVVSYDQVLRLSEMVMSLPTVPIAIREDIFRIAALEVESGTSA